MPYYATENQISTQPLEGGIEITEQQYKDALQATLDGRTVAVRSDGLRLLSPETKTVYNTTDKSEKEIANNDDVPEGYTETKPQEHDIWDGTQWVEDTAAKQAAQWERIRSQRDQKLSDTQWIMDRHSEQVAHGIAPSLTDKQVKAFADYRQALRDITEAKSADDVVWPENPLEE